ncbi:hypothetical protein L1887_57757 [Cichorium endivia]|nr:hypothetical protein L1887_57757 [Cichorium endivia]
MHGSVVEARAEQSKARGQLGFSVWRASDSRRAASAFSLRDVRSLESPVECEARPFLLAQPPGRMEISRRRVTQRARLGELWKANKARAAWLEPHAHSKPQPSQTAAATHAPCSLDIIAINLLALLSSPPLLTTDHLAAAVDTARTARNLLDSKLGGLGGASALRPAARQLFP